MDRQDPQRSFGRAGEDLSRIVIGRSADAAALDLRCAWDRIQAAASVGASVFKGMVAAIASMDEEEPVWDPLFLKTNGPVRLSKLWNTIEIHHRVLALNGPAAIVCRLFCGAYSEEALDDIPTKGYGFHDARSSCTLEDKSLQTCYQEPTG